MKTQLFFKHDLFDTLNVGDFAMFSFRVNDEIVSPKLNDKQFKDFMVSNPSLYISNMGEIKKDGIVYGIALEYTK